VARLQEKEIRSGERIRRIVGILRLDGREVEVHLPYYIEVAKISTTTQDTFTLRLSNPLIQLERETLEHIFINFVFSGVELFGKCRFLEQARSFVTLEYPESLKSRTKRRFQRVRMGDKIAAELKYRETPEIKMERVTVKELPFKFSQLYWEAQRDNPDIKKIFVLGLREIKNICPNADLLLYNKSNVHGRDARILRKSGKVLYVDFCSSTNSYTRLIPSDKLISYSYFLNEVKLRGATKEQIIAQLEEIIREDRAQRYSSKALIPLFSLDRVVGHVKVFQKEGEGRISLEDVNNLVALTKLIGLGIQKARYLPDLDEFIDSRLLNISEGGLLLKIEDQRAGISIPEGANVEVKFPLGGKGFYLRGCVCRKDDPRQFYAIKFIDLSPEEKKQIKSCVDDTVAKYQAMK
jgi:PilZ domain